MRSTYTIKKLLDVLPKDERDKELKAQVYTQLVNSMSLQQAQALEHIRWFLYGGRATGRTHVAAVATILEAIDNPNDWIPIRDHFQHSTYNDDYVLDYIRSIIEKSRLISLQDFDIKKSSIRYVRT